MVKLFNDFYFKIKQTNKKKIEKLKKKKKIPDSFITLLILLLILKMITGKLK